MSINYKNDIFFAFANELFRLNLHVANELFRLNLHVANELFRLWPAIIGCLLINK